MYGSLIRAELGRREVDKLVRVWLQDGGEAWVLIHVEVQSQQQADFAQRMYVYNYRLFDRYNRMVASLAVLSDEQPDWRPDRFGYSLCGCTVGIQYPVVKLLDYLPYLDTLETDPNPFAVLVCAHLRTQQTRGDPAARRGWKVQLIRSLYERGLSPEDVRQLFRVIDWMMDLPPELEDEVWHALDQIEKEKHMPYVTTVERRALEQGRDEGWQEALLDAIEWSLQSKFGPDGVALMPEIRPLKDTALLRAIFRAIIGATRPDDLRQLWTPDTHG
jgi:hypothetical protein